MKKNRGAEFLKSREARMAAALEERSPQRIVRMYQDQKIGIMVKVYSPPQDVPYRRQPVGWSE